MDTLLEHRSEWLRKIPVPAMRVNKYDRGYAVIFAAPSLTGATRLAAAACSRIGAGLVSVIASERGDIYRATLPPDIMVLEQLPMEKTITAVLGGPGGIAPEHIKKILQMKKAVRILDAGALPQRKDWNTLDGNCILTPHFGEFERIFGTIENPEISVQKAAKASSAIIVLKGPTTYIAHPSGSVMSHAKPNPYLAKAGTGDVLAGMIAGLAAQGMPAFEAACMAVWMHGESAKRIGPGLVAQDIEKKLPELLKELLNAEI